MTGPILDRAFLVPQNGRSRFPKTSRYHGIPTARHAAPDGTEQPYLLRRFPPHPAAMETIGTYVAQPADRRDLAAETAIGRVELWWRMADAAGAPDPDRVVDRPGTPVRLALDPGAGG